MKKRFAFLLAGVLMLSLLSGCGGTSASTDFYRFKQERGDDGILVNRDLPEEHDIPLPTNYEEFVEVCGQLAAPTDYITLR